MSALLLDPDANKQRLQELHESFKTKLFKESIVRVVEAAQSSALLQSSSSNNDDVARDAVAEVESAAAKASTYTYIHAFSFILLEFYSIPFHLSSPCPPRVLRSFSGSLPF